MTRPWEGATRIMENRTPVDHQGFGWRVRWAKGGPFGLGSCGAFAAGIVVVNEAVDLAFIQYGGKS